MSKQRLLFFGERIRFLRASRSLPLRKIAALLDIDPSLLSKIERNERQPSREQIKKLADIFDQNEDFLFTEYLSDQIVNKLLEENGDIKVLKAAEKKLIRLNKKKND